MRMKKEKGGHPPSHRHSAAASYEIHPQSALLHDHSDDYVLELFEQMLVSKTVKVVCCPVCEDLSILAPGEQH